MNQDCLISIIVPVYNAEAFIESTIQNVCEQTVSNWEILLIDDCSKDNTSQVIKRIMESKADERIKYYRLDRNSGAAAARNKGLEISSGRYIAFLDADDVWLPDRLEKSMNHMEKTGAGFVFTAYEFGDEDAHGTGRIVHVPDTLQYKEALSRTIIFTTTTLFDTNIISKELIKMPLVASEDTATWWQILRAGHIAYGLDEVTAIYRRPASSLSSNKFKAMARIWNLYRNVEKLSLYRSALSFMGWAYRATVRRL